MDLTSIINILSILYTVRAAALPSSCGIGAPAREKRIVGGREAEFGEWPWYVGIRMNPHYQREEGLGEVTLTCGGSVIHRKFILTAAHCVKFDIPQLKMKGSKDPGSYTVRLGDHDRSEVHSYQMDANVTKIHMYDKNVDIVDSMFRGTPFNDIALLEMDKPLEMDHHYIQPICLPIGQNPPKADETVVTIGWGKMTEVGNMSSVLREVELTVADHDHCREVLYPQMKAYIPESVTDWQVPTDAICAGWLPGGRDSCQYDSGGPLMQKADDGRWYLRGVVSIGLGCGRPNTYGLYTRVDHLVTWIQNIISEA